MGAVPQGPVARLAWVATVTFARTWRWASTDIDLRIAGVSVDVRWGLETDEQVEQLGAAAPPPTIAFPWPGTVSELLDHADGALAELALVPVDEAGVAEWERRLVVAGGAVRDIEVDPQTMVASVQLDTMEHIDTADLCSPAYAVSRKTWPLAAEDTWGARIPLVYGSPGAFAYATLTDTDSDVVFDYSEAEWWLTPTLTVVRSTRTTGATPAIAVDLETFSIDLTMPDGTIEHVGETRFWPRYLAACQGWADSEEVTLWVKNTEVGWSTRSVALIRAYDGLGQPVTLIYIPDTYSRKAGEWWIGWTGGAPLTGQLGALVAEVLRRSSVPVDWPSVLVVAAWLDRYRLGGYVDDTIAPVQWVIDRLKPFGVSARWGAAGFGLVLDHGPVDAVARIEVGRDAVRAGPLKISASEVDRVVVTWAANRGADRRQMRTVVERLGAVGGRAEELSAPEVWDETTAIAVARESLETHGPTREMVLTLATDAWWWLRASDVVHLVDEAIGADGPWRVVAARHSATELRQITVREVMDGAVVVASGDDTEREIGR